MNTPPTEYFGPHARRWTNPDTGVTLSLSPRDYHQLVAEEKEKIEAAAAANSESLQREADNWPHVITSDRLNITEEESALFKNRGVLIMPPSGWNPPEHQRYEMEVESSPIPPEMAGRYDAIVYGATRGGIKYPSPDEMVAEAQAAADTAFVAARIAEDARDKALEDAGLMIAPGGGLIPRPKSIDWNLVDPDLAKACDQVAKVKASYLSVDEGDSVGLIRPVEQTAPGEPAARHFRRRPSARNIVRLALVYIIAVIGVAAVVGVIS